MSDEKAWLTTETCQTLSSLIRPTSSNVIHVSPKHLGKREPAVSVKRDWQILMPKEKQPGGARQRIGLRLGKQEAFRAAGVCSV